MQADQGCDSNIHKASQYKHLDYYIVVIFMSDAPAKVVVVKLSPLWHLGAVLGSGRPFHYEFSSPT